MADAALNVAASQPATQRGSCTLLPRLIAGLAIAAIWEFVVRGFAPAYVAKPSTVILAIPRVIVDPAFLTATGQTLAAVAEGLAIALAAGTIIGLLMGRSSLMERSIRHYVNGFYAMPMIIVLPLFSLWLGYSGAACIATVIFAAIFSIIMNVADGAPSVPREIVEMAQSFRSTRARMLVEVVLPAATPYLLAGFRFAAGRTLIGAVVTEFFLSVGGLGHYLLFNSRTYHPNEAFVGVLLLAGFGVGFEVLVQRATRRFMPWYRRDEAADRCCAIFLSFLRKREFRETITRRASCGPESPLYEGELSSRRLLKNWNRANVLRSSGQIRYCPLGAALRRQRRGARRFRRAHRHGGKL